MAMGRLAGSWIVRWVSVPALLAAAVAVALAGFLLYWGTGRASAGVFGLFVLGLGVSLFFPLVFGQAMEAAGDQRDKASARLAIAVGVAVLTMPALLGDLAGRVGLQNAHLLVPVLIVATQAVFLVGQRLAAGSPGQSGSRGAAR